MKTISPIYRTRVSSVVSTKVATMGFGLNHISDSSGNWWNSSYLWSHDYFRDYPVCLGRKCLPFAMTDEVTQKWWKYGKTITAVSWKPHYLGAPENTWSLARNYGLRPAQGSVARLSSGLAVSFEWDHMIADWAAIHEKSLPQPSWVETCFSDPRLPGSVLVDSNPVDTGWSIWYLLMDVYEICQMFSGPASIFDKSKLKRLLGASKASKTTARKMADTYLGTQFGLLATWHDIRKFIDVCRTWRKRYDDTVKDAHLIKRRRFWPDEMLYTIPERDDNMIFYGSDYGPSIPVVCQVRNSMIKDSGAKKFCFQHNRTLWYRFRCPEFQGWAARFRQLIDAFGVLDPAAAWDRIPFFFVLDWFLNIGDWLHANQPRLWPLEVYTLDYLESLRLSQVVRFVPSYTLVASSFMNSRVSGFIPISKPMIEYQRTVYLRRRFRPKVEQIKGPPQSLRNSGWSYTRVAIASALLAQRLPEVPRRVRIPRA